MEEEPQHNSKRIKRDMDIFQPSNLGYSTGSGINNRNGSAGNGGFFGNSMSQPQLNKHKLEAIETSVENLVNTIKNEISHSNKRDQQLTDLMIGISKEIGNSSNFATTDRDNRHSAFVHKESEMVELQQANARLQKQIKDKIERLQLMENKLEVGWVLISGVGSREQH